MARHRMLRVPFLIAVLTATMLIVAVACGSSSESTEAPSGGSTATGVPVATAAATSVPAAAKPEGKLTIAITDMGNETPSVWQEFAFGKAYMRFLFDPLTGTNDAGEVDKTSGAAKEWSMSPDARKWTFTLRDNIKFHNGDPLTAEDVKFSIGLVTSEDSITSYKGVVKASIADQDSITVVSPTELVIDTSQPSAFLNWAISDIQGVEGLIQPKNYTESVGNDEFAKSPVGSGPYKWVGQRKGDFMEMEALDDHWRDGAPKFKTVLWRIIPEESTRIAALKAGEVDVISVSRERAPQLKKDGLNIFSKEGASVNGLYFHEQWRDNSVWKDINVRKAFNLAINREEICEFVFAGQCTPAAVYPWPDVAPGTDNSLKAYPFDPVEAKRLLDASDYNGEEIGIRSYPRADVPEGPRFIEAVGAYLTDIGVNVKIIPTEYASYRQERLAHTLDNGMGYLAAPNRPLAGFVGLMRVLNHSEGTFTSTNDPEIDRLIVKMETEIAPADVEAASVELYQYMHAQYSGLTCCNMNISYATNDKIESWDLGKRVWDDGFTNLFQR
ncbi:MAG: ABC transporter substrate-binding protein [Chloroflexi bacterium]|nr:ABC transporter substrate-binding protein [Chloroflexota bacterium]MDA1271023.1 ABC transporter substrate-binding protein [Chloroflexota bacterium]